VTGTNGRTRVLMRWASQGWEMETPSLGHSISLTDEGGAPDMKGAAKAYLGLLRRGDGPDDWEKTACRRDADGRYVTPLRAALSKVRNQKLRRFLHDLIGNALRPSDITNVHGVPDWAEAWVIQGALEILYREYQAAPLPQRSWVELSASQQNAETAA
jgi:hypothetical protein